MKIIFYSSKSHDLDFFNVSNAEMQHEIRFIEAPLSLETVDLISSETAVCVFVNDMLDHSIIHKLFQSGIKLIALRCAGFNNVDLDAANEYGIKVVHVPTYSPYAVAEHTLGLMLSLNRHIHRAYNRVRDGNFALKGLLGFDFHGRTMGIIGSGKIGQEVARITQAMGMKVQAYDLVQNPECIKMGVEYTDLQSLFNKSDVISLHCPLTPQTQHLINTSTISQMKQGVMLINTSRGGLLDSCAVIEGLKSKKIAYLGLDVYEHESNLFFEDLSCEVIQDDIFERLLTFPNVLITAHQAFFTSDALTRIADTTLKSIEQFEQGEKLVNEVIIN